MASDLPRRLDGAPWRKSLNTLSSDTPEREPRKMTPSRTEEDKSNTFTPDQIKAGVAGTGWEKYGADGRAKDDDGLRNPSKKEIREREEASRVTELYEVVIRKPGIRLNELKTHFDLKHRYIDRLLRDNSVRLYEWDAYLLGEPAGKGAEAFLQRTGRVLPHFLIGYDQTTRDALLYPLPASPLGLRDLAE